MDYNSTFWTLLPFETIEGQHTPFKGYTFLWAVGIKEAHVSTSGKCSVLGHAAAAVTGKYLKFRQKKKTDQHMNIGMI